MATSSNSARPTVNQLRLEEFKRKFARSTEFGEALLKYLERSHCGVWRCELDEYDRRRWWLNITVPTNVADMFDAYLEIQLVYVEYTSVEPRLLEVVQQRIRRDARVDPGLIVLASLDPAVPRLARRRRGEFAIIDLHLHDIGSGAPDIRSRMSGVLTAVDHYDITSPIREPSGFFGRQAEFDQIISAIERGQSTGVFGLRKTGKTSLLNYVSGRRREAGRPVVWLDISGLSGADEFRRRLVEETRRTVVSLAPVGQLPRLRTVSPSGEPKGSSDSLRSYWLRDIQLLSAHLGERLEVFVDEIDQANPSRSYLGEHEASQLLIALTQLRGMIQGADSESGIVLICAGVDPALFERPLLASGADNLLYKLVRLMFLAPMNREEMAEMVRDLGRRMGIRIRDREVISYLFDEYGGHPLLSRKACSLATEERPKSVVPWHMPLDAVSRAAEKVGEGTPLQQASEILDSYGEWFPEEGDLLRSLWSADENEREIARLIVEEDRDRVAHAVPYGLMQEGAMTPRVRAIERSFRVRGK